MGKGWAKIGSSERCLSIFANASFTYRILSRFLDIGRVVQLPCLAAHVFETSDRIRRILCLASGGAAFYPRHDPRSTFAEMVAATKKPDDEPGFSFLAYFPIGRGRRPIAR